MKIESNKNWTTCLRLNTGDGSPRVFLLNSHFLGSVPWKTKRSLLFTILMLDMRHHAVLFLLEYMLKLMWMHKSSDLIIINRVEIRVRKGDKRWI